MIQDGRPFPGPVELVKHHQQHLDGFLTKPTQPCERTSNQEPMAWPGVTMIDLELALNQKASQMAQSVSYRISIILLCENSFQDSDTI